MFALIDQDTLEIIQGPWRQLPGRLDLGNGLTVSPVQVGYAIGTRLVVTVEGLGDPAPQYHTEASRGVTLFGDALTITRTFEQTSSPSADDIKGEARSRILAQVPSWKQANMTARAIELLLKIVLGIDAFALTHLTKEERAEVQALRDAWTNIKAIRQRSDELEANPPLDFDDDVRWEII